MLYVMNLPHPQTSRGKRVRKSQVHIENHKRADSHAVAGAVEGARRRASAHELGKQHALAVDLVVLKQLVPARIVRERAWREPTRTVVPQGLGRTVRPLEQAGAAVLAVGAKRFTRGLRA